MEKCLKNIEVERLQIILLFKANCNFKIKILGQAFVKEAELSHRLANNQYGSQHFKDAFTLCLNKRLWYDYVHFWKEPADLCSNDIKSC